jgi:hypothetical protein
VNAVLCGTCIVTAAGYLGADRKEPALEVDRDIEDLQAVSDHVLVTTDLMRKLELEKRSLDPGSPRFRELAARIEKLASEVHTASAAEADIAVDVAGREDLPTIQEAEAQA